AYAVLDKTLPVRLRRLERAAFADQNARFLVSFANCGHGNRARPCRAGARSNEFGLFVRMQRRSKRYARIGWICAAARKDEFAGHEGMAHMAPAEKNADFAARPVKENERS